LQARERLGWPTDRPIVLCVRRLIRRMGLELVLPEVSQAALVAGLTSALRSEASLPSAKACRDHARDHFDWSRIIPRVRDAYSQAVTQD
jgi:hypothetical protein